jgi:hypothetical protein
MAFRIDKSLNDYLDLAAELLADETTPQFERGVFEMTAWTVGLNLSDPNDRGYLAVRLHLDLDRMYPPEGTETPVGQLTGSLLYTDQLKREQLAQLGVTVSTFAGDDGATVVQIDTEPTTPKRSEQSSRSGRVRVNVNDGTVFDADPEGFDPAGENPETRYFATGAAGDRMNYTATDDAQALDIARQANSPRSLTHYWGVWRADDGSYVGDVPATS